MHTIFAEICKVNPETRMVYGYASTEAMDVQGERVSKDALAKALPAYMQFANIREMHQPSAVGVAKEATLDEKGLYLAAKVVDDDAWNKVKEGVYKGFSIGGKTVTKVDEMITELRLSEISLVDRPANPEAVIEVWKAAGISPAISAIDELAAMLDAGTIAPEQLLALAKAQHEPAPAADPSAPADAAPADAAPADAAPAAPASEPDLAVPSDAPAVPSMDKAAALSNLHKFAGEEVYDTARALEILAAMYELCACESGEAEDTPDQMAALLTAISNLKAFIASEIAEDSMASEDESQSSAEVGAAIAMADSPADLAKVGKELSSKNLSKIQDLHDVCFSLGAKCAKGEDMAMADSADDLHKAQGVLHKLSELESSLTQLRADNAILKAEVERISQLPAPSKALLRVFSKSDDTLAHQAPAPVVLDGGGNINEAASLIKMIHQTGGVR